MLPILTAHLRLRFESRAAFRAFRLVEDRAAQIVGELHAAYAGGFAVRHAGDGRGDGQGDAAGAAIGSAVHGGEVYSDGWQRVRVIPDSLGKEMNAAPFGIARAARMSMAYGA